MTDQMHEDWLRDQGIDSHLSAAVRELCWLRDHGRRDLDDVIELLEEEHAMTVRRWD